MNDAVVGEAVAAELRRVCVEHDFVRALRNEETVVRETARGREIEHENEVATLEGEDLVAVVVPDFHDFRAVEARLRLDDAAAT